MAGGTKEAQKALLIKQKQVKYNYTSMTSFILPVHIDGKIKKEYEKKKPEIETSQQCTNYTYSFLPHLECILVFVTNSYKPL